MRILISLLAAALIAIAPLSAEILVKDGETVAFLGDSITEGGARTPGGYVRLVGSGLAANGVKITTIPAGISGQKSNQMLQRLPGILAKNPDWLTLSCGVNDVWHGEVRGVSLEDYKINITAIADQCKAAGVKLIILTSTQIHLPLDNANNTKLANYNAFLRSLAQERGLPLADLNADMAATQAAYEAAGLKRPLTTDGVHMNIYGNLMMARGVLGAMGLDAQQLATAGHAWLDVPNAFQTVARLQFTLRDLAALEALAKTKDTSFNGMINDIAQQAIDGAIKSTAE